MTNFDQFELDDIPQPTSDMASLVEGLGYTSNSKTSGLIKPTEKPAGVLTYIQPELPPRIPPKPPIQFTNEGVVLRQGVMKSPNHVRNLQGWQITSEGEGEFNSLSVRNVLKTVPLGGDIQSTATFVGDAGGGDVHLAAGTYYPTSDIVVPSNVTLRGTGAGTIIDFDSQAYQIKVIGSDGYTTGTVTVINDATSVTGSGTTWTTAMIGRSILLDGLWYTITNVTTSTALTIGSSYVGSDLSGDVYAIATFISGANVQNLTVQNSTAATGAVYLEYLDICNVKDVQIYDSTIGLTVKNSSGIGAEFIVSNGSGTGTLWFNDGSCSLNGITVIGSTGVGFDIESVRDSEIANFTCTGNGGTGMELINCSDLGIVNFTFDNNTGKGIELISGNDSIQIIVGTIVGSTSDGIKLTATTDKCSIGPLNIENSGGYGINIAASTCDDNLILGVNYLNNFSGAINDSGTDTILVPNTPSFIAAEDLTKGQPVGVSNYVSGQVARAFRTEVTATTSYTSNHSVTRSDMFATIGGDKFVFIAEQSSNDTLYVTVASIDPNTNAVTLGTSVAVTADNYSSEIVSVSKLDTDKFIVFYVEDVDNTILKYRIGTVSGTTITLQAAVTFEDRVGAFAEVSSDYLGTDKGVVYSSGQYAVYTVSGTTLTKGTNAAAGISSGSRSRIRKVDTDKFIAISTGSGADNKVQIGTVSGTTITLGSAVQFSTTLNLDLQPDLIVLSTSLAIIRAMHSGQEPYYTAISISGTTATAGTELLGTQYCYGIVKDSATSFLASRANVSPTIGSIQRLTVSGTTITNEGTIINPITCRAWQLLELESSAHIVGINYTSTNFSVWIEGMANHYFGFAESTVSAGESLGVITSGKIGGLSGLVPGALYQIGSSGLTLVPGNTTVNTADDIFVTASSATEVVL